VSEPERYLEADGGTGLRYGFRLAQGLEVAYRAVGWPADGSAPTGEQLAAASDALDGVLRSIRPDLAQVVLRSEHEGLLALGEDLRSAPDLQTHVGREGLGLFLWMPTPFTPHGHPSPRSYSLQLVAASTHAHRAYWSFRRKPIAVNAYAADPAAQAAFGGQPVVAPGPFVDEPGLWRSVVAVPLSAVPAPDRGSTIALGAVVLASDRDLPTSEEGVTGPLVDERLAAVAYLSPAEVAEYCRIVLEGVSALLAPPP